jgi:type I restriction enzyme M protein
LFQSLLRGEDQHPDPRQIAARRQSDTIAFFKVENDGFGLGAQRRAIEKNDLPQVQAELAAYLQALRTNASTESILALTSTGQIVPKKSSPRMATTTLSGERYREGAVQSTHFPWRTVESLVETVTPPTKIQKTAFGIAGRFPIIDQSQDAIAGWTDDESTLVRPTKPLVIFGDHTCAIKLVETPFAQGADGIKILQTIEALEPRFLFYVLRARPLESDGYQRHYSKLKEHQIPLPPLEVQKEIVAEIEGYQKVINGARAVLDHYRPHIPIHRDWPMVRLGDLAAEDCSLSYGIVQPGDELPDGLPIVRPVDLTSNLIRLSGLKRINPKAAEGYKRTTLRGGEVLLCVRGTTGVASVASPELAGANVTRGIVPIRFNPHLALPAFGLTALCSDSVQSQIRLKTYGATLQQINIGDLRELQIPLPPLATQHAIVAEIEAEQALVAANRELITRFEQKIQATLARIWGEDESVPAEG